jgi:hypothetical protein
LKIGETVGTARYRLAVDDARADCERLHGRDDGPEAGRPIEAAAGADALAFSAGDDSVAIVLDLMQPAGTARRLAGWRGKARLDENGAGDRDTARGLWA